ncbi:MAG: choice-of-anchor J domain-containing protein [Bacteroidales bacterium]|nr:choice-of-anchor J domain-containing protein [Bacteroidales bacterium]
MKKTFIGMLILFLSIFCLNTGFAQMASDYEVSASLGTYVPIMGTYLNMDDEDDGEATFTLPFAFTYCGTSYNSITASTNGMLSFTGMTYFDNDLSNSDYTRNVLAPYWDDLMVYYANASILHATTGTSPNRIVTIQFEGLYEQYSEDGDFDFQVKLYETSNIIEFVYGSGFQDTYYYIYPSASIGINNFSGGTTHFLSVTPAGFGQISHSITSANNLIDEFDIAYLVSGTTYTFELASCSRTSDIAMAEITPTSATLNWGENDNVLGWLVSYRAEEDTDWNTEEFITDNEYVFYSGDLTINTSYIFRIRTLCTDIDTSSSYLFPFITPQNPALVPYEEDFESGDGDFLFKNETQGNQWIVGAATSAQPAGSTSSLYISNNGSSHDYISASSINVYAYKTVQFDDPGEYLISYDWKCMGETNYDYAAVWIAPYSANFAAGFTPASSDWINLYGSSYLNADTNWHAKQVNFLISEPGLYNLIFYWENDNGVTNNPPIAIDNISIDIVACESILAMTITDLQSDNVTFDFDYTENTTDMKLYYWASMSAIDSAEINISDLVDDEYTVTGLTPSTTYTYYVVSICGDGISSILGNFTFTTLCNPITEFPLVESFEDTSSTRTCWTIIDANQDGTTWSRYSDTTYARTGSYSYRIYTNWLEGDNDDYLISPQIALTGSEMLKFYTRVYNASEPDAFEVLLSNTGIMLANFTDTLLPMQIISHRTYTLYEVDLSAYTGNAFIAFRVPPSSTDGWYMYIDDISIETILDCSAPIHVGYSDLTTSSIDLTWNFFGQNSPDEYLIAYGHTGFNPDTTTNIISHYGSETYQLTGLTAAAGYDVYLKSVCDDDTTVWSTVFTFTMECELLTSTDLPYSQNFEAWGNDDDPYVDCWERINTYDIYYGIPYIDDYVGFGGSYSLEFEGDSYSDVVAIMTGFDQTVDVSLLEVNFKIYAEYSSDGIEVGVMTDPTDMSTFTLIELVTPSSLEVWEDVTVYMSEYAGTGKYIAFRLFTLDETFVNIDNVVVQWVPSCLPPTGLTATVDETTGEVTVSWNDNDNVEEWEIAYDQSRAFDPEVATTTVTTTTNSYVFSSLEEDAFYTFYVRADCGQSDVSEWSLNSVTLPTACLTAMEVPYFENFDSYDVPVSTTINNRGFAPPCWRAHSTNTNYYPPHITNSGTYHYPASGSQCLTFTSSSAGPNSYVALPKMNLPLDSLILAFAYRFENATYGTLYLGYMTDNMDTSTFTQLATITGNSSITRDTIVLSGYTIPSDAQYLAFHWYKSGTDFSVSIDDISIYRIPEIECYTPTNLAVSAIQPTSATVTWTAGGIETTWIVEHREVGGTDYDSQQATTDTATLNVQPERDYEVRVKAVCDTVNESEYITLTFTTPRDSMRYTIEPSVNGTGTITPSTTVTVVEGGAQRFEFTPGVDQIVQAVLIDGEESEWEPDNSYTFVDVRADHTIEVVFAVGIEIYDPSKYMEVYPNPTTGELKIKSYELKIEGIRIFDMYGKELHLLSLDSDLSIDLSHLSAGVYFLKIATDKGVAMKKVVKN